MSLSISVAIITFNGENYILDQLESIKFQTLSPEKVIIFDDFSSDSTVKIVTRYINDNNLHNWQLFTRTTNVGWRQNIFDALMKSNTDIVFWSDQDDVWENNKIEILASLMNDTKIMAAYSSWRYIDSYGRLLEFYSGNNTEKIISIDKYSKKMNIPPLLGCSACFRRELLVNLSKIIPCEFDSPDWILYFLAINLGNVLYIDRNLFKRRIHEHNVTTSLSGMARNWKFNYENCKISLNISKLQLKTIEKILKLLSQTTDMSNSFLENEYSYLKHRILFIEKRMNLAYYLYFSYKQNNLIDFVYIFLKDMWFILKS